MCQRSGSRHAAARDSPSPAERRRSATIRRRCPETGSSSRCASARKVSAALAMLGGCATTASFPACSTGRGMRARSPSRRGILRTAMTGPSGLHAILDVVLEGQTTVHPSILAEYQQDPVRGKISHIDLREVRLDQPIQASVVVHLDRRVGRRKGGRGRLARLARAPGRGSADGGSRAHRRRRHRDGHRRRSAPGGRARASKASRSSTIRTRRSS